MVMRNNGPHSDSFWLKRTEDVQMLVFPQITNHIMPIRKSIQFKAAFIRKDNLLPLHGPTFLTDKMKWRQTSHFAHSSRSNRHFLGSSSNCQSTQTLPRWSNRRRCWICSDDSDEASVCSSCGVPVIHYCVKLDAPRFHAIAEHGWCSVISENIGQM